MNKQDEIELAMISKDIKYIQRDVVDIKHKLESQYVTQTEFEPIKKIVYGIMMLVLTTIVIAIVSVVLK